MKNKQQADLAIFGPYPPPYGGISVHLQRMYFILKKEKIPFVIYNHNYYEGENIVATRKSIGWYFKFLFNQQHRLVHFHQFFDFHFLYYFLFTRFHKIPVIITIHSERLLHYPGLKKKIIIWLLKNLKRTTIVSVSKNLHEFLKKNKINSKFIPAYVPPHNTKPKKLKPADDKINFLFSVWKINKDLSEKIYDVPLIFKFLSLNKDKFHMTFMIGDKAHSDLEYLNELIKKYKIENNVQMIYDKPLVDYLPNFRFLVRTNISDGYGVSLQEAMDLGVPAIASDTCVRPEGTVLFKTGDPEDLSKKITYVISTDKKTILKKKKNLTYHKQLVELYKSLLKLK